MNRVMDTREKEGAGMLSTRKVEARGKNTMDRRKFFGGLLLSPAAPVLATSRKAKKTLLIQKTHINGMAYYRAGECFQQIKLQDWVILKREAGNSHDALAVEAYWRHQKLGYVPRLSNFALAKLLDEGEQIRAHIVTLNAEKMPWKGIEIEIEWVG